MTSELPPRQTLHVARAFASAAARQYAAVCNRIELLRRSDPYASAESIARRVGVTVDDVHAHDSS
jgi:hypothetical protein